VKRGRVGRLPLISGLTAEFDRALKRHVSEVRDYTAAFHRRWARRHVTTMRGTGWAVRPFILPAPRLDFIASTLHAGLSAARNRLRALKPGEIGKLLPYRHQLDRYIDVRDGLDSPAWLSHLRPDGFLFEDRYVLSEINFGNGIIVSCGYTEAVDDYWKGHPIIRRLGWDVSRWHRRPFPRLLDVVQRFARPSKRPLVALLAHSEEWKVVASYPKRITQQIDFAISELARRGIEGRVVTEQELVVDRKGQPRIVGERRPVDLVMLITIGSSFADQLKTLGPRGSLARFRSSKLGDVWIIKPLAGLVMDKGCLPFLSTLDASFPAVDSNGFRFEIAATEFPFRRSPSRYTREKDAWVVKRAFDGKDTHVGIGRSPETWRSIAREIVKDQEYIAQKYVSMPRARVPVFVDEKHLEWIESRVELSTFIYEGSYGGAAARHAPDAEGLVMTDPPPDYGFSSIFTV
jgi:hypothetical protein